MGRPAPSLLRNQEFVMGLLLCAVTCLVYLPALNGKPLWDDNMHMTPPELRSWDGLLSIWTHSRESMQYFPIAHTVFWIEGNLWGDSTFPYHLLSVLLHVTSCLIWVRILRKLNAPGAWLAAAIFALHPVMVESVAWITELKNALSGVFFSGAMLTYLTYDERRDRRSYATTVGLFILSLLSKSTMGTFPLAMLAVLWFKGKGLSFKRDILPLLPFLVGAVLFGLITLRVEQTHIGMGATQFMLSPVQRWLLAGRALAFYLGKLFFPVNLMFSYPRWDLNASVGWAHLFPVAVLVMGGILWTRRKVWRGLTAAFLYFVVMLLPYLGFRSFYTFRYSFVADHYQYLAAMGPIAIVAGLLDKLGAAHSRLKTGLAGALLLVLGTLSCQQNRMYADAETLYRTTIMRNDGSWMAHNELGILSAKAGRSEEALAHYRKSLDLNPNFAEAHNNIGLLLSSEGQLDEALAHYQSAVKLDPASPKSHLNLGATLAKMGRPDEALDHYQKALELSPNQPDADFNLGALLSDMGRTNDALAHYQRALEVDPNYVDAHNNLGILLRKQGRTEEALGHYQQALGIDPNRADVQFNLADLLSDVGRTDEALSHYNRAIQLDPDHADSHYNLALLLAQSGRAEEAVFHYRRTLDLKPDHSGAHGNLGILLASSGQIDEALTHFRRALEIDPNAMRPLKNLAIGLGQKGQWAEANAILDRALTSARAAGDSAREAEIRQFVDMFRQLASQASAARVAQ